MVLHVLSFGSRFKLLAHLPSPPGAFDADAKGPRCAVRAQKQQLMSLFLGHIGPFAAPHPLWRLGAKRAAELLATEAGKSTSSALRDAAVKGDAACRLPGCQLLGV